MSGNVVLMGLGGVAAVAVVASIVFITPLLLAVLIAVAVAAAFFVVLSALRGTPQGEPEAAAGPGRGRVPPGERGEEGARRGAPASGEGLE